MATDRSWNYGSPADMLGLARQSLQEWRDAPGGSAAERRAARCLAFAFGRLDELVALGDVAEDPGRQFCRWPERDCINPG